MAGRVDRRYVPRPFASEVSLRSLIPYLLPLSLALPAALVACEQAPPPTPGDYPVAPADTVLTTVNGNPITTDMRDTLLKQMPEQMRTQLEQTGQLDRLDEQLVIGDLLYRDALTRNLHTDPEVQKLLAMTARTVLADKALDAALTERLTDEALQAAYDERAVKYKRAQAKVRVIAVETDEETATVSTRLAAGEEFGTVASQVSKDPNTSKKGGDLGWMSERDIAEIFRAAVFGAEKGAVVGPLPAGAGQVFFYVEDKRDGIPLEEVREELENELKTKLRDEYFDELKAGATISSGGGGATLEVPEPGAAAAGGDAPAAGEAQ